jgi:hypothetical protein
MFAFSCAGHIVSLKRWVNVRMTQCKEPKKGYLHWVRREARNDSGDLGRRPAVDRRRVHLAAVGHVRRDVVVLKVRPSRRIS